jgi:serine/threonine protein kinase
VCRWVLKAAHDTATALGYLHEHHIAHGDVYAHNMLADDAGNTVLCDYGASFFYPSAQRRLWEPVEVCSD